MKIMLDCSPAKIKSLSEKYGGYDFWQLRTPLTGYKFAGVPYGLDNGCFTRFDEKKWKLMIEEAKTHGDKCQWVTLPDVVGSAIRTCELFERFAHATNGVPRALVLQDGIGSVPINWRIVTGAVFIGGSDNFKTSKEAFDAARCAKFYGLKVHVGRVNTPQRLMDWLGLADSIDGSGISRFSDAMLGKVISAITEEEKQHELFDDVA